MEIRIRPASRPDLPPVTQMTEERRVQYQKYQPVFWRKAADSAALAQADFEALDEHGFEAEDIWDIASITAFFALSNRMANFLSLRPNDEFFSLGRGER